MRKQTEAGLRRKGTFFERDMIIHTEPITIRNKLNSANNADARLKSESEREKERESTSNIGLILYSVSLGELRYLRRDVLLMSSSMGQRMGQKMNREDGKTKFSGGKQKQERNYIYFILSVKTYLYLMFSGK